VQRKSSGLRILESEPKKQQFAVRLYLLYHPGEPKNWVRGSSESWLQLKASEVDQTKGNPVLFKELL